MTTETKQVQENEFYNKVIQINGKFFSYQTGILLVTSSRGHKYTIIMYDHESITLILEAFKSK